MGLFLFYFRENYMPFNEGINLTLFKLEVIIMKKLFLLIIVSVLLTGCGEKEAAERKETETIGAKEFTINFIKKAINEVEETEEEEDLLVGYERYSKEYIENLYYNGSNAQKLATAHEYKVLVKDGYSECEIDYILLVKYGDIEA